MSAGKLTVAQLRAAAKAKVGTPTKKSTKETVAASPCKYKDSMTPGAVAIVLSGRYAGRRVVVLKSLGMGNVAVCGPRAISKVPLRAYNQKMLMGTSTKVDISGLDTKAVTAEIFKNAHKTKKAKKITEQMEEEVKYEATPELIAARDVIDSSLVTLVEKADPLMKEYLADRFSLTRTLGVPAHDLKF